jgi:xylulokinase
MDRRSEASVQKLKQVLGDRRIEQVTGNRADPFYVAPKILWYRTHEPERFKATSLFVQANGYINYRLTGKHSLDTAHAALLQLRDYKTERWSEPLCYACGIEPVNFPPVYPGEHVLGELTRGAAEAMGLMPGIPVMVGTVDAAAAALGAGVARAGTAAEMTGTSTVLIMPSDRKVSEPVFIAMPHCVPRQHLLLGAMAATGASLRWFREQFGTAGELSGLYEKENEYDLLTGEASRIKPGSDGVVFLPYMMGERSPIWHTNARGVFFGLTLSTTRGALIRAILEGAAFALLHNAECARGAGLILEELRSVGGGTRSALWNQIKADVLGISILLPETYTGAAFGAAMLAGIGSRIYTDIEKSLKTMIRIRARFEPNPENHRLYREIYQIYRALYEDLRGSFDRAASIGTIEQ